MKKVWLYHRESTEAGAMNAERHFAALTEFAEKNGYEVVGQSFDCCGWRDTERAGLATAKDAVRNKEADAVLVVNFRIIARDMETFLKIGQSFGKENVFVSTLGEEAAVGTLRDIFPTT